MPAEVSPQEFKRRLRGPVLSIPTTYTADFRVDYNDDGEPQGLEEFERIGKMGVHTFMIDSTNAEKPGHSMSEKTVERNLEEIFKKAEGRIIVATFASLLTRIGEIIKICERLGRKVAFSGYKGIIHVQIESSDEIVWRLRQFRPGLRIRQRDCEHLDPR